MYLSLISAYKIDHLINIIGITVAHTRQTIKFNVTNVVAISPGKKMPLLRHLNDKNDLNNAEKTLNYSFSY